MTDKYDDGGPAYPVPYEFMGAGMSLHDAFAIAVLPAIYAESVRIMEVSGFPDESWRDGVAMDVYAMADAMIAERNKRRGEE